MVGQAVADRRLVKSFLTGGCQALFAERGVKGYVGEVMNGCFGDVKGMPTKGTVRILLFYAGAVDAKLVLLPISNFHLNTI